MFSFEPEGYCNFVSATIATLVPPREDSVDLRRFEAMGTSPVSDGLPSFNESCTHALHRGWLERWRVLHASHNVRF